MATDPINAYAVTEGEAWLVPTRTAMLMQLIKDQKLLMK